MTIPLERNILIAYQSFQCKARKIILFSCHRCVALFFPLIILSIKKWSNKFFHELQPFSIRLYCLDFFKNRRKVIVGGCYLI